MRKGLWLAIALSSGLLVACGDGGSGDTNSVVVNKPPVATDDFFNIVEGGTINLDVLANDVDPEAAALTLTSLTLNNSEAGVLSSTTSADKTSYSFAAKDGFVGDAKFTYVITDSQNQKVTGNATVTIKALQSLSSHQDSNCLVSTTGSIKCWGGNDFGQLGNGTPLVTDGTKAFKNTPVTVANVTAAKQVAIGYNHACAILQNGSVSCWGDNNNGQLGDGTQTTRLQATPVTGLAAKATQLALSYQSTCALLETGNVQCWGSNSQGVLGLGDSKIDRKITPTTIVIDSNLKAKRLVAGKNHFCAISQNDSVYCWGNNDFGQLGQNHTVPRYQPVLVSALSGTVQQLETGVNHTCAARSNDVYCWGSNNKGQLGNNSQTDSSVPVAVSLTGTVADLALGQEHSCAVLTDNRTFCWGSRQVGQTTQAVSATVVDKTPVQISSFTGKRRLSAGDFHSCTIEGIDASLTVKCWGDNQLGQLGDGSTNKQSATPVSVKLN
ncbi:MAG: Ig-like domain-containing protein [Agitococcus sp.]